jgi:uncharacterized protein (TIGR00730 family)
MRRRIVTDLLDPDGDAVSSWRVFRILAEFVDGFELLRKYKLAASIFGSARTDPADPYYRDAEELAGRLAQAGFTIITGGGHGIMKAANSGAHQAKGKSVGLTIDLPMERHQELYFDESQDFHFFFTRKVMLAFASEVYVFFPGGFGTLDEFFELTMLVQTGKISSVPIVLYGRDFWEPLTDWIEECLLMQYGTIDREDIEIYRVVDSIDEAYEYVMRCSDHEADQQL